METTNNLKTYESVVRIILGIVLLILGYRLTTFVAIFGEGGYPLTFWNRQIYRFHNIIQILMFFLGFAFVFTGITRFSPLKEIISRLRKKKFEV